MTLEQIIDHLKTDPAISRNITHWQVISSRDARMVDFPTEIDEQLYIDCMILVCYIEQNLVALSGDAILHGKY